MRKIAVEEHFFTREYLEYMHLDERLKHTRPAGEANEEPQKIDVVIPYPGELEECLDVGEGRLRAMDEAGIDMQVLSFSSPGVEGMPAADATVMARKVNDELAEIISRHPDRFAGFATIAAHEPESAAHELERAVTQLGLRGVKINSHVNGEYLDDTRFWPIFETAEKLDIPIYLHPRSPSPDLIKPFLKYPVLVTSVWGFGAEVGLHAMRLICSGLFDKYPNLKIMLGHLGEGFPFFLWRFDEHRWERTGMRNPAGPHTRNKISHYVKNNFYVTTSGNFWMPALLCAYMSLGADRILFAVDYPMESSQAAVALVEAAPIADADKEKIFHGNAERLLRLPL